MSFVSFEIAGKPQIGLLSDDGIINLSGRIADPSDDMKTLIAKGVLRRLYEDYHGRAPDVSADNVIFQPVVPNPAKIICVGVNYDLHRLETGRDESAYPTLFTRFADTLTGHKQPIILPRSSSMLDYEGELAVVIGTGGRNMCRWPAPHRRAEVKPAMWAESWAAGWATAAPAMRVRPTSSCTMVRAW